jgi:hypothetical protein
VSPTRQVLCSLALLLGCAGTAAAQSPDTAPEAKPAASLRIPLIVWSGAVAADQATTYRFSSQYRDILHETNPVVRGLDHRPALLVAAGSALDASMGWTVHRFLGKKHPRIAAIAFYSAAAYRTYLAFYNIGNMRRAEAVRLGASGLSTIPR